MTSSGNTVGLFTADLVSSLIADFLPSGPPPRSMVSGSTRRRFAEQQREGRLRWANTEGA